MKLVYIRGWKCWTWLMIVSSIILVSGCVHLAENSKEQVLRSEKLKGYFNEFDEISPRLLSKYLSEIYEAKIKIIDVMRARDPENKKLLDYLNYLQKAYEETIYRGNEELLKEINSHFDTKHDHLFHYEYRDGSHVENGWMIICHGRLKYKIPLGEGTLGEVEL